VKRFSSEELMVDVLPAMNVKKTTCDCTQCTNNTPNNNSAGSATKKTGKGQLRSRNLALLQRQLAGVADD